MRFRLVSIFFLFLIFNLAETAWSLPDKKACQEEWKSLAKIKDSLIQDGGMWTLFERSQALRPNSNKALRLDSKVQQLVWLLEYLCKTIEGVPLNELAIYLDDNLKEKSKTEFREELLILGKTPFEIDIWFKFAKISKKNEHRKLDLETIRVSFQKARPLILRYKILAKEIEESEVKNVLEKTKKLHQDIDLLESSDPYLSQALLETSQVPYWDINESTGGS